MIADDIRLGPYGEGDACECQSCAGFAPCCDRDVHQGCGRCLSHCFCALPCACGVSLERIVDRVRGLCAACFAAGAVEITQ